MKLCYCGKPHRARGLCHNHYEKWRRGNPLDVYNKANKWVNEDGSRMTCFYPECDEPIKAHSLCMSHYQYFYYRDRKNNGQK